MINLRKVILSLIFMFLFKNSYSQNFLISVEKFDHKNYRRLECQRYYISNIWYWRWNRYHWMV